MARGRVMENWKCFPSSCGCARSAAIRHSVLKIIRGIGEAGDLCFADRIGVCGGHKILLFSQFASMLERIQERLLQEGISSHLLVGATPKEERSRMVQAFASDEVPVFLISLKAGERDST